MTCREYLGADGYCQQAATSDPNHLGLRYCAQHQQDRLKHDETMRKTMVRRQRTA
jgi:hypothetical protein